MKDSATTIFGVAALREKTETGEALLEKLYDEYAHSLYRYAFSILGTPEDAEDAVQDLFIRLARDCKRLKSVKNIKAYLFKGARNSAFNILRSRRKAKHLNDSVCNDILLHADEKCYGNEHLREAFSMLPVEQREILTLKIFEGMTFNEISKTIGVSINTVASRYRYGIEKLRHALEECDGR